MDSIDVRAKWVDPQTAIATRCFVSDSQQIQSAIEALQGNAAGGTVGAPICLFLGHDPDRGYEVEIAVPVAEDISVGGHAVTTLPGDHVLSAVHIGPYKKAGGGAGLRETAEQIWSFIVERHLLAGDNPTRYVYLEGPETHGSHTERYVTEIQISYHFPAWIASLERGLGERVAPETAAAITAGADAVRHDFDADHLRTWVRGALDRLDAAVPRERTRACILNGCAHRYPKSQLERMRAACQQEADLVRFIERLDRDDDLFPAHIFRKAGEPKHIVFIEKVLPPWNRAAYDRATDPVEKRYLGCFCSLVKEVVRTGEGLSPSFCHCAAGWFVQMWEAILGRSPIRVDVVRSILRGDDRCLFAIHLPQELFPENP